MNVYAVVLFVGVAVSPIVAQNQVESNGTCPITVPMIINETMYAGQWYEVKRFPNTLVSFDCANPFYTWTASSSRYNVTYSKKSPLTYELRRQVTPSQAGRYDIYIDSEKETPSIPYNVLLTDYTKFSVVWGCRLNTTSNTNFQRLFILSRATTLNATTFNTVINPLLASLNISTAKLVDVAQSDSVCKDAATTLPSLTTTPNLATTPNLTATTLPSLTTTPNLATTPTLPSLTFVAIIMLVAKHAQ